MTSSLPEAPARGGTTGDEAGSTDRDAGVRTFDLSARELRAGDWTRLGDSAVLGDAATEGVLSALAADARTAARAQGYLKGWTEGKHAAEVLGRDLEDQLTEAHRRQEQRRELEHQAAVQALTAAVAALGQATAAVCERVEMHATETAVALTEALLGHELSAATSPGLDAVRRALALAPGEPVVRIRLAPQEAADPQLHAVAGAATVVSDPALRRGDALVETAHGVVDARVSDAVRRVREVLLP